MHPKKRAVSPSDWRAIASLGEQLVSAQSLKAQQDRIIGLTARLVRGNADVWLHEDLFRLPDRKEPRSFPRRPAARRCRAFSRRRPRRAGRGGQRNASRPSR
jgi:hypothetical protein